MGRDRADATDVDIRFVAATSDTTRLEITHSGWERLGAGADAWRDANRAGWGGLLSRFAAACTPAHPEEERETWPTP
jgi:hypothetical protein